MKPFSFSRTPELLAGPGSFDELFTRMESESPTDIALLSGAGWFPGSKFHIAVEEYASGGGRVRHFTVKGEPSPSLIDSISAELKPDPPSLVLAVGGGSVLDTGKAVAAMLRADDGGSIEEFLEGVGTRPPPPARAPLFAVPTTAGTGSEATKNAVVTRVGSYKKSLRHDAYVPDVAVLDPVLQLSCPPAVTAASGLDAITQLVEAFVSTGATPLSDALCREGLAAAGSSFARVVDRPDDVEARFGMAYAAYLSGIALANAGLGIVHGLASPLGSLVAAPHGALCAALVGPAVRLVAEKLAATDGREARASLARYAEAARILLRATDPAVAEACDADASARLADALSEWRVATRLRSLDSLGYRSAMLDTVARSASPKNTPCRLDSSDVAAILEAARREEG